MWHNVRIIGTSYSIIHMHVLHVFQLKHTMATHLSSVASSSSVLTDSSYKSNVSEGEEKLTSASTILDRLKVPKVSDFVCK